LPINKNARELLASRAASERWKDVFYCACISLALKGVRAARLHVGVRFIIVIPLRMDVIIASTD